MIKAVIFDMYETLITHYKSPLYFSGQMAKDIGISKEDFQKIWRATEYKRTIGELSFEEVLEKILKENDCYSKKLYDYVYNKRIQIQKDCFQKLHEEIIEMLNFLKAKL